MRLARPEVNEYDYHCLFGVLLPMKTQALAENLKLGMRPIGSDVAAPTRPRLLDRPRVRAALLLAPLFVLIFSWVFLRQTDSDYWWHVRTGQYIFETGTVPTTDIYSYTVAGQPWVTEEWLTQLLLYVVSRQFGYVGNVVLFGFVSVLTWLIVYATCRQRGMNELGAGLLMTWGFAMGLGSTNVRPQMMSPLFLAIAVLLLTRYKQGNTWVIWLLPPLLGLWGNVHGGFVTGLAVLWVTTLGEALTYAIRRKAAPLKPLLAAATLSTGATLVNPNGLNVLLYPLTYSNANLASMRYVLEWQSPNFHQTGLLVFAASLLLAIFLGMGKRPLGLTEALWSLMFALMALESARHIPLYAVVLIPLLAARLQAELPALQRTLASWRRPTPLAITWLALVAAALCAFSPNSKLPALQLGREPSAASYPAGAVDYIQAHGLKGNLFHEYNWGGYLIYHLYSELPVFIDGRADPFGDQLMENYRAIDGLQPNWRQLLDEYDVRIVLMRKDAPLSGALANDATWQEAYSGDVEKLFVRK